MTSRERADRVLVARGIFESRARAQAAIVAGRVTADGIVVRKPSEEISATAAISAEPVHPYVSRGALKLAAALDHFRIDVTGLVCLDVGASTGGFTEVLIERGARRVYAVDVGRDQLHHRLRSSAEVFSLEQTDIRAVDAARLPEPPDFGTIDVSFISLKLVLPAVAKLLKPNAGFIALIKPQYEAGRRKKGVVRDDAVHAAICSDIEGFVTALGWHVAGLIGSPILGGDGNREFLLSASRTPKARIKQDD
jgi:23S rRNA (cytidine1920-2'-O)/16S rRNA (cytidine1409-2'-O)-methyltransferase